MAYQLHLYSQTTKGAKKRGKMEAGIGAVLTIIIMPLALLKVWTQKNQIENQKKYISDLEKRLGRQNEKIR